MKLFDKINSVLLSKKSYSSNLNIPDFNNLNEIGQISFIFNYIVSPDTYISQKAAETIQRLFTKLKTYNIKELYSIFKNLNISKSTLKKFDQLGVEEKQTLLVIASLNGNGYIREEALLRLGKLQNVKIFPFVLFRLADWVKPIREKAEKIIEKFLKEENSLFFIQNHNLITWTLKVNRIDLTDVYDKIISVISNKQLSDFDLQNLKEGERLFYFKIILQRHILTSNLVTQILNDKYYLVRMLIINNFNRIVYDEQILMTLLSDKNQRVRQGAFNLISQRKIKFSQSILESLIYDDSALIRFESRKLLSQISDGDFRELYRQKIFNNKELVPSILGLSEVGCKDDISIICKFLEHDRAKVKNASLMGIYNLDKEMATKLSYRILREKFPTSTKKTAERIFEKQGIVISLLREIYDLTDLTGKIIILRLINKFSGWSSAGDFLKAITEDSNDLKLLASEFLKEWGRYTVRLSTKQTQTDKDYVLKWYNEAKTKGIDVPADLPFIFGNKRKF